MAAPDQQRRVRRNIALFVLRNGLFVLFLTVSQEAHTSSALANEHRSPIEQYGATIVNSPFSPPKPAANETLDVSKCSTTGPTSCRFTNLTNGEQYFIRVYAIKTTPSLLISESSIEVSAVPEGLPSGPRDFRVAGGSSTDVLLRWGEPENVDPALPIAGYEIYMNGFVRSGRGLRSSAAR